MLQSVVGLGNGYLLLIQVGSRSALAAPQRDPNAISARSVMNGHPLSSR